MAINICGDYHENSDTPDISDNSGSPVQELALGYVNADCANAMYACIQAQG